GVIEGIGDVAGGLLAAGRLNGELVVLQAFDRVQQAEHGFLAAARQPGSARRLPLPVIELGTVRRPGSGAARRPLPAGRGAEGETVPPAERPLPLEGLVTVQEMTGGGEQNGGVGKDAVRGVSDPKQFRCEHQDLVDLRLYRRERFLDRGKLLARLSIADGADAE